MHFLRTFLVLYSLMVLTSCCQLDDNSSCQKQSSSETTGLESSSQCEGIGPPKVENFLEHHVHKIFQDGELNLFNLQRVMSDIMNDPQFRVLLEGMVAQSIDNDKIIGMADNDDGGTCGGAN